MKDLIDMEWVLSQLKYNLVDSKLLPTQDTHDFLCNKLIKQHLHEEYIQIIALRLPQNAYKNFLLELDGNFYERFTLDDMNLITLGLEGEDFTLIGDINGYITEDRLIDNKNYIYLKSKVKFNKVKNMLIENAEGDRVFLKEPFKYPINLLYGAFSYNINKKTNNYTVYLQSVPRSTHERNEILKNIKKYTFQINFEYEDIDLELGKEIPDYLKKENDE